MWKFNICFLALVVFSQAAYLGRQRQKKASSKCPEDCVSAPMDISLVVDASRSIGEASFTRCLTFLQEFVSLFSIGPDLVRVSLVTYGEKAYDEGAFGLTEHQTLQDLTYAISHIDYKAGGATNTSDGIWYMIHHHSGDVRPNVRHVVMVITDGQSQNKRNTKAASQDAHGITNDVFAIGVGSGASPAELHTIATDDRHVFMVDSYDQLTSITKRLAYQACDVPTFPECEMDPVDIALVIDSSRSIGPANFTRQMDFVRDFVGQFQVDPQHVRFGMVTFGKIVYQEDIFTFSKYANKQDVLSRINSTVYHQGEATYTWLAIEEMRENIMQEARANVPHVCIVITDGQSQNMQKTIEQAEKAKAKGIVMYAVGIGRLGDTLSEEELQGIASEPQNMVIAESFEQLHAIQDQLVNITCSGILSRAHSTGAAHQTGFALAADAQAP